MKLFFADMHRGWGGQPHAVVLLASELTKRGHDVILGGVKGAEMLQRAAAQGVRTWDGLKLERGLRLGSFLSDQRRLAELWKEFRPEGLLTNGAQDTWTCAAAFWRLRPSAFFVRWRHNSFPVPPHFFNRYLYRRIIDHVVVSSMQIAPLLTGTGLLPAERVSLFPCSTHLEQFLNAQPTLGLRKELGVAEDGFLAAAVGRLAPEKGHEVLLRAWTYVVKAEPQMKLAIAGAGGEEPRLRELAAALGLNQHVHFLGFRRDVPQLYAEADLAVLAPVAGESFGIALLEAYAAGRPCVATDVGGVRDLVIDGRTGLLVRPRDPELLAAAILRMFAAPEERAKMAQAGKAHVLANFTPKRLADTAEQLFEQLRAARVRRSGK